MKIGQKIDKSRRTALYRLYDGHGDLLYVGIAFTPRIRWHQHATDKGWWTAVARREATWFDCRDDALTAEREAIATEMPKYNQVGAENPALPPTKTPAPRRQRPATPPPPRDVMTAFRLASNAERRANAARTELDEAIRKAVAAGDWQIVDVSRLTGWSRETIRKIAYPKAQSDNTQGAPPE